MELLSQAVETVRNERIKLTDTERATIDALNEVSFAGPAAPEGVYVLAEARKALARDTLEALRSAIPDLEERARAQAERWKSDFDKLKGTGWPVHELSPAAVLAMGELGPPPNGPIGGGPPHTRFVGQPPHVGELWWAETSAFRTGGPANTLAIDIHADPNRIFGHIRYNNDNLFSGSVGLVMTFILDPERLPRTSQRDFDVRPETRLQGWVSGWTDQYHPIWHADDKWSKCWRHLSASLTLSSGEGLCGDDYSYDLFLLENVNPVGQASISEFFSWHPYLRFTADMQKLRQHGVSIISRWELRYDFQLEGGSDIWFRRNPGSAAESVPAFDNALTFRFWPGTVRRYPSPP